MIVIRKSRSFVKSFSERDLFEGMTAEGYHGRTDQGYDANGDKAIQRQNNSIGTRYADLVGRIDRFLNDPPLLTVDNTIRKGTQYKVRESLQVIQNALKEYG